MAHRALKQFSRHAMIGLPPALRKHHSGRSGIAALTVEAFRKIDISIDEPFSQELSEEWLRLVVDCALQVALPADEPGQVSLLVADDATVRDLNRGYRGLDEVTDVLSFSTSYPGHWEGGAAAPDAGDGLPFVLPPDELPMLGDIVVSYPQAQRQALARHPEGLGLARELALLIVHGVLHLVGHDHLEPEETALMQAKEQAALSLAFSNQPNPTRNRGSCKPVLSLPKD